MAVRLKSSERAVADMAFRGCRPQANVETLQPAVSKVFRLTRLSASP